MKNSLNKLKITALLFLFFVEITSHAQEGKKQLRLGNEAYNSGKYKEAAELYQSAIKKNPKYDKAYYNYGASVYKACKGLKKDPQFKNMYGAKADSMLTQKYLEAATNFDTYANGKTNSKDSAQLGLHNLGNAYLMGKDYKKAVDAYKKALKYNPKDEDTRYNLAYAQKKLKEQEDKDKQNKQKNENNKDEQQKKNEDQKKDIKNDKQNEQKEQQQNKMSKEEAQRMLDALKNTEKKLQNAKKMKGKEVEQKQIEKDW